MTRQAVGPDSPIRSRSKTLAALNKVVDDLIAGDEKLSITSVARAAGVTPGLIHNTYPSGADPVAGQVVAHTAPDPPNLINRHSPEQPFDRLWFAQIHYAASLLSPHF